jgi:2-polyprenyl-6-methoxyphenol hydroxylase-like FAD-dependent oxidoreductase
MAKQVLIAGAGIGGLTAAISLRQAGFNISIFEASAVQRDGGAGLWLWENAMSVLDSLHVGNAVRQVGIPNAHGGVRTWQGEPLIKRVPASEHESIAILRADLLAALMSALDPRIIHFGVGCTSFSQDARRVTLQLSDGSEVRGDILIGADGIHSVVRTELFGTVPLSYAGFTAWRAVIPFPHNRIPVGISWGRASRFGFMPIRGGRVNWFAGRSLPPMTPDSPNGPRQDLLDFFQDWPSPIPEAIAAADEADILRNDIYYAPPLKSWSQGRVALLGDAAHSMTPSIGQGACQTIEDAGILADCLRTNSDAVEALRSYEQQRMRRAYAVVRYSRFMDWLSLWKNPVLYKLRNLVIKTLPDTLRDKQLEWIINHRA